MDISTGLLQIDMDSSRQSTSSISLSSFRMAHLYLSPGWWYGWSIPLENRIIETWWINANAQILHSQLLWNFTTFNNASLFFSKMSTIRIIDFSWFFPTLYLYKNTIGILHTILYKSPWIYQTKLKFACLENHSIQSTWTFWHYPSWVFRKYIWKVVPRKRRHSKNLGTHHRSILRDELQDNFR